MSGSGIKGEADSVGHLMLAHYRKPGAAGTSLEYVCYKTVLPFSLFLPKKNIADLYSDYNEPLDI